MPRQYNKQNADYWEKRKIKSVVASSTEIKRIETPNIEYAFPDEEKSSANASYAGSTEYQNGGSPSLFSNNPYPNINAGMLPWETMGVNGYFGIGSAIVLCQRAYANVSIFRNTIENAVEFSNSPIHIKTSNQTVKDFFTSWFDRINLYKLKENFFREYYRSGNVFLYRFNGKISNDQFGQMKTIFGSKSPLLPIRYMILNPAQIYLISGVSYNNNYVKALSRYEIERLKTPLTDEDKQVFNSLPENVKSLIKSGGSFREVFIPLDRERLRFAFYKKQDYEPLALPFGFPILNDLEYKLDLKKMDMSLSKTVEHIILLITNGEKVDQYGGGINPRNIQTLQDIFRNRTLGRVLVADHSTKGQWLVPDISEILGPEKYVQVEKDIRDGLQSIMYGDDRDKPASILVKARIYIEKMADGQRAFLNNFLIPEIKEICESMNFKNVPDVEFEKIDLDDKSQRERLFVRLLELGVLSPSEIIEAIESGILPDSDANIVNQKLYKPLRDSGLFQPLLAKPQDGGDGRPPGSKSPQTTKKVGPIGQKSAKGEEFESKYSITKIGEITASAVKLENDIIDKLKLKFNIQELNSAQANVAESIVRSIMINEKNDDWENSIDSYINNPKDIDKQKLEEINEIAIKYELTPFNAIIVGKSKI